MKLWPEWRHTSLRGGDIPNSNSKDMFTVLDNKIFSGQILAKNTDVYLGYTLSVVLIRISI